MPKISQANEIIARVERGDLNEDLTTEIRKVLEELGEQAAEKKSAKGEVTLKLKFEVEGRTVDIVSDISSKVPKRPRAKTTYFVAPDGALSTDHPQQEEMFAKPREVRAAAE